MTTPIRVKLAFRAECKSDVDAVINAIKNNPQCGTISNLSYKQDEEMPDVDVDELELKKDIDGDVDKYGCSRFIKLIFLHEKEIIKSVLEVISKCEDCHTIYETIDLKDKYTGDRTYAESHLSEYVSPHEC